MIWTILQIAIGGAVGTTLRFLIGTSVLRVTGPGFPLGAMTVNIFGCLAMGVFAVFERGGTAVAALYIGSTMVLSIASLAADVMIAREIFV